jgi:hypothetical protein
MNDIGQKALVVWTLAGIVLAFAYFSVPLAVLATLPMLPFLVFVLMG